MLLQVRDYILQQGMVSRQQLARQFHIDEQALEPMVALWIKKGFIRVCQAKLGCQASCLRCSGSLPVYYEAASPE